MHMFMAETETQLERPAVFRAARYHVGGVGRIAIEGRVVDHARLHDGAVGETQVHDVADMDGSAVQRVIGARQKSRLSRNRHFDYFSKSEKHASKDGAPGLRPWIGMKLHAAPSRSWVRYRNIDIVAQCDDRIIAAFGSGDVSLMAEGTGVAAESKKRARLRRGRRDRTAR